MMIFNRPNAIRIEIDNNAREIINTKMKIFIQQATDYGRREGHPEWVIQNRIDSYRNGLEFTELSKINNVPCYKYSMMKPEY